MITVKNPFVYDWKKYIDTIVQVEKVFSNNQLELKQIQQKLLTITETIFISTPVPAGIMIYVFLKDGPVRLFSKTEQYQINCAKGDIVIFGSKSRKKYTIGGPKKECLLKLYEYQFQQKLYLSLQDRIDYKQKICSLVEPLHKVPIWEQCCQKCFDLDLIGKGCYGNVFKSSVDGYPFALKISKLKPEAVQQAYDLTINSWHELHYLTKIIQPILQSKKCPNLPLIFDHFLCKSCQIELDDKVKNIPCITTLIEFADGNLRDFLQLNPSTEEIYSAVFQIMAGLHAIQMYGQMMNYDIKKENILYYRVQAGGYWKYVINKKDYFVPNFGYLFILNDFGISRTMSPHFPIFKKGKFRLGSRYAQIVNGQFFPISQKGEQILLNQKKCYGTEFILTKKGKIKPEQNIENFLLANVFPPFEFYNDTQDAIRMFIGGKRTTQKGNHKRLKTIPNKVVLELSSYIGLGKSADDKIFRRPEELLAGSFITSFFEKKYTHFTENVLEEYVMD